MEQLLSGKKLLVLGATAGEVSLVKRAQQFGAYVIVTDYHQDWLLSPAKYAADEAWDVSWSDIDTLKKLCIEHHVDGVTAGYSEFRVENMIKLCEQLSLPAYSTMEQLEITRDKIKFKDACRKYHIPVVHEYSRVEEVNRFPVIVKPVDRAGSIGISVATSPEELQRAYDYAMEMSVTKQVIMEDFIHTGNKIDLYYGVEDGEITLLSGCDTINAADNGFERVVQSAWLYPMRKQDIVLAKADQAVRSMIRGMGIRYGCIFYSGFILPDDEVVFFECGFRMEGAHQYEYVHRRGLMNFLDIFIFHALTGSTQAVPRNPVVNDRLKSVVVNVYGKRGRVGKIAGFEEIRNMPDCTLAMCTCSVGETCDDNKAILNKLGMFSFCHEDPQRLRQDVADAYACLTITNEQGGDMIYDRVDPQLIEDWWRENDE